MQNRRGWCNSSTGFQFWSAQPRLTRLDSAEIAPLLTSAAVNFLRDAKSRCRPGFTDLTAAVQLRLRVAIGLQALQRCSGLLNRRARGSTVATHHFGGGTRIEKSMRGFGADAQRYSFCLPLPPPFQRSRSSMYRAPRFERGGCRRDSCRECQSAGMWLNPNSRGSRLRIWQPWGCNSLHAHQFHGDWLQREQQTPAT